MSTAGEISGGADVARHAQDWYIEPPWTVDLLLDADPDFLDHSIRFWDPCCGSGTIPRQIAARGFRVMATDIIDRGLYPLNETVGFLGITPGFFDGMNIWMNPPYRHAEAFIRHALKMRPKTVAALVQAKFPYSQRRYKLFTEHVPHAIYFLSTRPSIPPGHLLTTGEIEAKGGKVDYCWIVWSRDHPQGWPTACHWLKRGKDVHSGK